MLVGGLLSAQPSRLQELSQGFELMRHGLKRRMRIGQSIASREVL